VLKCNRVLQFYPQALGSIFIFSYYLQGYCIGIGIHPLGRITLTSNSKFEVRSYFTTDSQSGSMSWCRAPFVALASSYYFCRYVAARNLQSSLCGAPFLTRGRVCSLECNHSVVPVAQNLLPHFTLSSETPTTWTARFPYLYHQENHRWMVPASDIHIHPFY
jgi:hypothetical protein